ncbi:ABC transporter permease subunit, partial [Pseudomonas aeruginosa]
GGAAVEAEHADLETEEAALRQHPDRRAAGFVGFREKRLVWFVLLFSGALAGLAGVCEVAGPIGQLVPQVSPGYGYAAITVAFLGRLNPFGILCASLLMALLYLGG